MHKLVFNEKHKLVVIEMHVIHVNGYDSVDGLLLHKTGYGGKGTASTFS